MHYSQVVAGLCKEFAQKLELDGATDPMTLGVITPYAEQRRMLDKRLKSEAARNPEQFKSIHVKVSMRSIPKTSNDLSPRKVATVDGFQGGERDVIIFSCVQSGGRGSIGFLADVRRMNVALTRARYACWVIGDPRALNSNPHWKDFIYHCQRSGAYVPWTRVVRLFRLSFSDSIGWNKNNLDEQRNNRVSDKRHNDRKQPSPPKRGLSNTSWKTTTIFY